MLFSNHNDFKIYAQNRNDITYVIMYSNIISKIPCVFTTKFAEIITALNKAMYGRLEIRILSSRFEKICHKFSLLACNEYFTKNICEDVRATVQLSSDIQYQEIGAH